MKKLGSLLVLVALSTVIVGCAPQGDPSTVTNPNTNTTDAPPAAVDNTTN